MKAAHLDDGDWTLTVSETPMLAEDLTVTRWLPCYWEVRNSAMGEWVAQAVRVNTVAPWIITYGADADDIEPENPEEFLSGLGIPDLIIARMRERSLLYA